MKTSDALTWIGAAALVVVLWRRFGFHEGYTTIDPATNTSFKTQADGSVVATDLTTGEQTVIFTPL